MKKSFWEEDDEVNLFQDLPEPPRNDQTTPTVTSYDPEQKESTSESLPSENQVAIDAQLEPIFEFVREQMAATNANPLLPISVFADHLLTRHVDDPELEKKRSKPRTPADYRDLAIESLRANPAKNVWSTRNSLLKVLKFDRNKAYRVFKKLLHEGVIERQGPGTKVFPYVYRLYQGQPSEPEEARKRRLFCA
jgi:hypothetical protein